METKTCSLTEDEIKVLIIHHGKMLSLESHDDHIDRINYLNKRLNAKPKDETSKIETQPAPISNAEAAAKVSW